MKETMTLKQAIAEIMKIVDEPIAHDVHKQGINDGNARDEGVSPGVNETEIVSSSSLSLLADYIPRLPAREMKAEKGRLQTLTELAWLLYVQGERMAACDIVEPLTRVAFDGNYNRWTWLEHATVLYAFVAPEPQIEEARQGAIQAIEGAVHTGDKDIVEVKQDVHERFLNGETLDTSRIEHSVETGDRAMEAAFRLILLKHLRKLELLGGSKTYPAEQAAQEAEDQIAAIRQIIAELGLFRITPFR